MGDETVDLTTQDVKDHIEEIIYDHGVDCDWYDYYFWIPFDTIAEDLSKEAPEDAYQWLGRTMFAHEHAQEFVIRIIERLWDKKSQQERYTEVEPTQEYIDWYEKLDLLLENNPLENREEDFSGKKIVVFDIGGVLRASKTRDISKDELKRNYEAACAMYKTFVDSPDWKVIVVTQKSKKKTYKQVVKELAGLGLPEPDDIRITYDDKEVHYKELNPDIVFDDNHRWIAAAAKHGAYACHVVL